MKPGLLIVAMRVWRGFVKARGWGEQKNRLLPWQVGSKLLHLFVNRIFSDHIGSSCNHQLIKKPQQSLCSFAECSCKI